MNTLLTKFIEVLRKYQSIILVIAIALGVLIAFLFIFTYFLKTTDDTTTTKTETTVIEDQGPVEIPEDILQNKFGFGVGDPGETDPILAVGAKWARPHVGHFVWESMQESATSEISFTKTDEHIQLLQENNIGTLTTLWAFADWDQIQREDAADCLVSDRDIFLPHPEDLNISYLPQYRCNPYDWEAYENWVSQVVERYDGDGIDDMPGLQIPVKYWEIMNEPDLAWDNTFGNDNNLNFYKEGPAEYAQLLKTTYTVIKDADPEAQVLIAGAAGGNSQFLAFYRGVFDVEGMGEYFDIGNVHCISNDEYENFNVKPYVELLKEYGLEDKPIWVTEAEALMFDTQDENATQTRISTQNALDNGAERIFYTSFGLESKNMESVSGKDKKKLDDDKTSLIKEREVRFKAILDAIQ